MAIEGIELSSGIAIGVNSPIDAKYGTYADTATAISDIGATLRYQGLTVGVLEAGSVVEYWWKDGTSDGDLVVKESASSAALGTIVDAVFDNSGTALPATTATTIDGVTVTDGAKVLVTDSSTVGEIDNIYTASLGGANITWTILDGYGADGGGVDGQVVYVEFGSDAGVLSSDRRTAYMFGDSTWVRISQAPFFSKLSSIGTVGEMAVTASGPSYIKKKNLTVDKVFADAGAASTYYGSNPDQAKIYLILDTMVVSMAYQFGFGTFSASSIDVSSQDYIMFCPELLKYYQYNGVDAVEEVTLPNLASQVTVDDASFDVLTATDAQDAFNEIDSALFKASGTEVLGGTGAVTFTIGTTVFDVAATSGQIKDSTGYYPISYAGATGISVTSTIVSSIWVYIDNTGALQQQTTEPTRSEFRERLFLTRLALVGGTLAAQEQVANPAGQYVNSLRDYLSYILSPKKGLALSGNASLTFQVAAGSIFELGTANAEDEDNPNEITFTAQDPASYFYVDQDSTISTGTTNINVTQYDVAGTPTTMTNNRFKIETVYKFNSGNHVVQMGQNQYQTLDDAQADIASRSFVENPILANGTRLGWIIVQEGSTDLSDTAQARFVQDLGSSSTSVAVSGALLASNNLSDLDNTVTALTNLGALPTAGGAMSGAITGNYETDARRALTSETTTARTLALGDAGDFITFENASASTCTIPTNASVAFPTGTEIDIVWLGAGEVTIEGDTGVTLNGVSAGSTAITAQYGGATIKKIATDTWLVFGKINDVA